MRKYGPKRGLDWMSIWKMDTLTPWAIGVRSSLKPSGTLANNLVKGSRRSAALPAFRADIDFPRSKDRMGLQPGLVLEIGWEGESTKKARSGASWRSQHNTP